VETPGPSPAGMSASPDVNVVAPPCTACGQGLDVLSWAPWTPISELAAPSTPSQELSTLLVRETTSTDGFLHGYNQGCFESFSNVVKNRENVASDHGTRYDDVMQGIFTIRDAVARMRFLPRLEASGTRYRPSHVVGMSHAGRRRRVGVVRGCGGVEDRMGKCAGRRSRRNRRKLRKT
jgi:hypothetical protein